MEKQTINQKSLIDLIKNSEIKKELIIQRGEKHEKTAKYRFYGEKLELLLSNPSNLKDIVSVLSSYQYTTMIQTSYLIPIEVECDLTQIRKIYQSEPINNPKSKTARYQLLTNSQTPYFDLCFQTELDEISAKILGLPNFDIFQSKDYINNYTRAPSNNISLKDVSK